MWINYKRVCKKYFHLIESCLGVNQGQNRHRFLFVSLCIYNFICMNFGCWLFNIFVEIANLYGYCVIGLLLLLLLLSTIVYKQFYVNKW